MNQLNTSYTGKMPVWLDDFRFIINMFKPFLEQIAIAVSKNDNKVLTGCGYTASGSKYTVGSGYVLIDGELCHFPGGQIDQTQGHYIIFIVEQTIDQSGARVFGDGTTHDDIYIIRQAKLALIDELADEYCYLINNGLPLSLQNYEPVIGSKGTAFNKNFGLSPGNIAPITDNLTPNHFVIVDENEGLSSEAMKSAFNKDFGTASGSVAQGNHSHSLVYEPVISPKGSAFNKDFGATAGSVSEGNHNHDSRYFTETELATSGQSSVSIGNLVGGVSSGIVRFTDYRNRNSAYFVITKGAITEWFVALWGAFSGSGDTISSPGSLNAEVYYDKNSSTVTTWSIEKDGTSTDHGAISVSPASGGEGTTEIIFTCKNAAQGFALFNLIVGGQVIDTFKVNI